MWVTHYQVFNINHLTGPLNSPGIFPSTILPFLLHQTLWLSRFLYKRIFLPVCSFPFPFPSPQCKYSRMRETESTFNTFSSNLLFLLKVRHRDLKKKYFPSSLKYYKNGLQFQILSPAILTSKLVTVAGHLQRRLLISPTVSVNLLDQQWCCVLGLSRKPRTFHLALSESGTGTPQASM